jgi:hypothetical protein
MNSASFPCSAAHPAGGSASPMPARSCAWAALLRAVVDAPAAPTGQPSMNVLTAPDTYGMAMTGPLPGGGTGTGLGGVRLGMVMRMGRTHRHVAHAQGGPCRKRDGGERRTVLMPQLRLGAGEAISAVRRRGACAPRSSPTTCSRAPRARLSTTLACGRATCSARQGKTRSIRACDVYPRYEAHFYFASQHPRTCQVRRGSRLRYSNSRVPSLGRDGEPSSSLGCKSRAPTLAPI